MLWTPNTSAAILPPDNCISLVACRGFLPKLSFAVLSRNHNDIMWKFRLFDWHDAQLTNLSIKNMSEAKVDAQINIEATCYLSEESGEKVSIKILFQPVNRFTIYGDVSELSNNFTAGNIYSAQRDHQNVFKFDLLKGYIEIQASDFQLIIN